MNVITIPMINARAVAKNVSRHNDRSSRRQVLVDLYIAFRRDYINDLIEGYINDYQLDEDYVERNGLFNTACEAWDWMEENSRDIEEVMSDNRVNAHWRMMRRY